MKTTREQANAANNDAKVNIENTFAEDFFAGDDANFDIQVAAATHPGNVRPRNEDHYAVIRRTRGCEMLLTNLPADAVNFVDDQAYGILVADGVGGANFGDFASQLVLETIFQAAGQATSWLMKYKSLGAQEVQQRINAYVIRIQDAFRKHAQLDPNKRQMGSTLTAVYLMPPHAIFLQIGDSRAYLFRDGGLVQITRDHTLSQAYVEAGADPKEVQGYSHVLINSLDGMRDDVVAELLHLELQPGDRLLLCTDGLSDLVDADNISSILAEREIQAVCDKLIEAALQNGGHDNITTVVCDVSQRTEMR